MTLKEKLNEKLSESFANEIEKLTDEFADRNYPKKDELLGDIRRTLEHESAAPQSVP